MHNIDVKKTGEENNSVVFHIQVSEDNTQTEYEVTVKGSYHQSLNPSLDTESLVRNSFEFLLERERKESILSEFDLSVIAHYFPEYEEHVKKW